MDIFNNKTEIIFTNSNSAIKAKEIAAEVIASMEHNYDYQDGIKNTIKKLSVEDNALILPENDGELDSSDLMEIMTEVVKAIAEVTPKS